MSRFINTYLNRRLLTVLFLGFSSGLPLALTASTLQAWYSVSNVDIVTIGALSLVGMPYLYKFIWAPVLDRYVPPLLGRRRGWMLLAQIALILSIIVMAGFNPTQDPGMLALLALLVATCSATQDIAIDAYRTDLLPAHERGLGAAMAIGGYRLAMLVSGGGALILADQIGWRQCYLIMAVFMLVGVIASILGPEPELNVAPPGSLKQAIIEPLKDILQRRNAGFILCFIVLYKLIEAFTSTTGVMTNPFLLSGLGFSLTTVGVVNKVIGLAATILGVFIGGIWMTRLRIYSALMIFGIFQAVSNLGYLALAIVGKNLSLLVITIFLDNLSAGLGMAALIAYIMSLCNPRYTATQFALLSALAAVGRVLLGPVAGEMVKHLGWSSFYIWTFILALPSLLLLWWLQEEGIMMQQRSQVVE